MFVATCLSLILLVKSLKHYTQCDELFFVTLAGLCFQTMGTTMTLGLRDTFDSLNENYEASSILLRKINTQLLDNCFHSFICLFGLLCICEYLAAA